MPLEASSCVGEEADQCCAPDLLGCPLNPLLAYREDTGEIPESGNAPSSPERVRLFQGRLCRTRFQGRFAAADGLLRLTALLGASLAFLLFPFEFLITVWSHGRLAVRSAWIKIGLDGPPSAVLDWCSGFTEWRDPARTWRTAQTSELCITEASLSADTLSATRSVGGG